ncbi:MAG: hypothetical protein RMJ54_19545, partial [Roseiflexaceae bacterium]|nr:hypothetical protein [Roseiflexaceae bacterium]
IEVFRHYRQRIPNNAFPIIGVVGVALGTSTVWMGWVIVGATMMICCSILAVYTRTFRGNHGMSDSSARPLSWRVWLIGFAIIAFAASVLVPQNDANSFHSDENTSQDTPT